MDQFDNTPIDPQVCKDCKQLFTIIDPEAYGVENRCRDCQTAFRIKAAAVMHASGKFIDYKSQKITNQMRFENNRLPGMW